MEGYVVYGYIKHAPFFLNTFSTKNNFILNSVLLILIFFKYPLGVHSHFRDIYSSGTKNEFGLD